MLGTFFLIMDLRINLEERLRVNTSDESVFIDISRSKDNLSLNIDFYEQHFHQLRKKERYFKLFSAKKVEYFEHIDFGFFEGAEIVWKSY